VLASVRVLGRLELVGETFRDLSEAMVRGVVGDRTVNEVLTVGRQELANESARALQKLCDQYEMGVVVDSPGLAEALAATMERDMGPENSWRVELDPQGELRWVAGDQVLDSQPARGWWQRVEDVVFMAFPKEIY